MTFWWRGVGNVGGIDAYSQSGERLYRYILPTSEIRNGAAYPSPNGQHAVLVVGAGGRVEVTLIANDEQRPPQMLYTGIGLSAPPAWSPDGRAVAIAHAPGSNRLGRIEVYALGDRITRQVFDQFNVITRGILWTQCR